jgi:hypothetical protein
MPRKPPVPMTHPFDGHKEFNLPRAPRQTDTLFRIRYNPLNEAEINRIVDELDRAVDEYIACTHEDRDVA